MLRISHQSRAEAGATAPNAPNQALNASSQWCSQAWECIIQSLLFLVRSVTSGPFQLFFFGTGFFGTGFGTGRGDQKLWKAGLIGAQRGFLSPKWACVNVRYLSQYILIILCHIKREWWGAKPNLQPVQSGPVSAPHRRIALVSFASAGRSTSRINGQRQPWWYWTAMATLGNPVLQIPSGKLT